jgi:hypothetical protein
MLNDAYLNFRQSTCRIRRRMRMKICLEWFVHDVNLHFSFENQPDSFRVFSVGTADRNKHVNFVIKLKKECSTSFMDGIPSEKSWQKGSNSSNARPMPVT